MVSDMNQIRHESLRISVIQRLESYLGILPSGQRPVREPEDQPEMDLDDYEESNVPFEPFMDLCKRRFLWYYESYKAAVEKGKGEVKPNEQFARMPFESPHHNGMDGKFDYVDLDRRLDNIKAAIDAETEGWAAEGLKAVASESTVSVNLKHQFEQVVISFKESDLPHNVMLENGNPFLWVITYFGQPMTNLDGGLFRIKLHFSPRFPDEQPRVRFETKIFHHLISSDGTVCYVPKPSRIEDVRSHIEAILSALEEDEPAYDPRKIVNLEASRMFWNGGKDNKKLYNRKLRRSVQESME
jgi:ubiquitin-conjugating enzyme E2 Z